MIKSTTVEKAGASQNRSFDNYDKQLTGRNAQRRKIGNNTYAERRGDTIAIRLHDTDILTFNRNGSVIANSGGWKTATTKARLNEYLPLGYGISQNRGVWYWYKQGGFNGTSQVFTDGDMIRKDGTLKTHAKPNEEAKQAKFRKRVLAYAKLCANAVPLELPSGGDCWHCAMKTEQNESLGDAFKDTSHLESHMNEEYIVPSLVFSAMIEKGWTTDKIPMAAAFGKCDGMIDCARREVKTAVARYIFKRYGMAYK